MTNSTLTHAPWVILRNHEGRYSVFPLAHAVPAGWQVQGEPAGREACLARIAEIWTDMRPSALQEVMA
ncbi:MbtH family protein [Neogemmobacter tilapiae]|uniref:MbtH protein n=1 Tax=Neogemmobacter tilapiae TaxID=875041 RepID=A0A918TY13_9RHOB|nr:MbtH family NRPS accessory protein [Gemmobacter tilapiae]GHC65389.1 MbtH protein [Gemmobacter tilapiae]